MAWDDPPPMPSGAYSEPLAPIRLTCRACAWMGEFEAAVAHAATTSHALAYKGVVQDLSRHVRNLCAQQEAAADVPILKAHARRTA